MNAAELEQIRRSVLLARALTIVGLASTMKEGREKLTAFSFDLTYPEMEGLLVHTVEALALKLAAESGDVETYLKSLATVTGVLERLDPNGAA